MALRFLTPYSSAGPSEFNWFKSIPEYLKDMYDLFSCQPNLSQSKPLWNILLPSRTNKIFIVINVRKHGYAKSLRFATSSHYVFVYLNLLNSAISLLWFSLTREICSTYQPLSGSSDRYLDPWIIECFSSLKKSMAPPKNNLLAQWQAQGLWVILLTMEAVLCMHLSSPRA